MSAFNCLGAWLYRAAPLGLVLGQCFFKARQSHEDISLIGMCPPKRDYMDGLIVSHGCDKKNDLSLIINRHVFMPSLFGGQGITSNKRGLGNGQQKPSKEMRGTLQGVTMLLSIGIFFVPVAIDLRAAYHQPKFVRVPRWQIHRGLPNLNNVKDIVFQDHFPLARTNDDCWVVLIKVQV